MKVLANNVKIKQIAIFFVAVFIVFAGFGVPKTSQAFASSFFKPFGGSIATFVPSSPLCPVAHTIIYDYATLAPFAIASVPSSEVYSYENLYTTGAYVLGTAGILPITCPLPYSIYPIRQVGTSPY